MDLIVGFLLAMAITLVLRGFAWAVYQGTRDKETSLFFWFFPALLAFFMVIFLWLVQIITEITLLGGVGFAVPVLIFTVFKARRDRRKK